MNALPKDGRQVARDSREAERVADRLLDARRTLERDYALPLTVQRLARHARLPHLSFNRAYHDAFGIAPLDHLRLLRLQAAARLLVDGRAAADIAIRVGYPNVAVFKAEFRRLFRDDAQLRAQLDLALQHPSDLPASNRTGA